MPRERFRRSVCTFHDLFVLTGDYSTPEFRARFGIQAREAAKSADLIIAVSEFTAGQVCELLGVEPGRVRVIHHGARIKASASQRQPLILSVGALQVRKNTSRLVEAFERVTPPPWRLMLAGSFGFGVDPILERVVRSPAVARIECPGWLDDAALGSLYARASIFAFPSLDEGFGMPALDAMASGVPVITSNRSALPEVCGDAAVLVDPSSVDEIAGALERLIGSEALREEYARKGLARAAGFTWQEAVERTWSVYGEL